MGGGLAMSILALSAKLYCKKGSMQERFINTFLINFILRLMMESYLLIMFSAFVNAAVIKTYSIGAKMSLIIAILSIGGGLLMPVILLYLTRVETERHPKIFSSIIEGINLKSISG